MDKHRWFSGLWIGVAAVIHPSFGLQLGLLLAAAWIVSFFAGIERASLAKTAVAVLSIGIGVLPSAIFMLRNGSRLFEGLSSRLSGPERFNQSPQHMLPHLWRMPQWLAWGCYPLLAAMSLATTMKEQSASRRRLLVVLVVSLIGLGMAWVAIEVLGSVRVTVFQPFRIATVTRGLCLIAIADRVRVHWDRGDLIGVVRAALLVVGLSGDWSFVVVSLVEVACAFAGRHIWIAATGVLSIGLVYLSLHDTESGHLRLLAAVGVAGASLEKYVDGNFP